ncbi:MAG: adenine phosphoribosyltransferase [Flavobacteriales bacterium]|nr:adenine phosphoribosyltransferase [Flavobacteriales bacterium]
MEERLKCVIRDFPDYPHPGIVFKDISPVLKDVKLYGDVIDAFVSQIRELDVDAIVGIESRGFWFGPTIAHQLRVPFIPIRKKGKLPGDTYSYVYDLEYGSSEIEMQMGCLPKGSRVLIHDDLLATGGTAKAATHLIDLAGAKTVGFAFLVHLTFLKAEDSLKDSSNTIISLAKY